MSENLPTRQKPSQKQLALIYDTMQDIRTALRRGRQGDYSPYEGVANAVAAAHKLSDLITNLALPDDLVSDCNRMIQVMSTRSSDELTLQLVEDGIDV